MEIESVERLFDWIALVVSTAGLLVIIYGAIVSFVEFIQLEFLRTKKFNICKRREHIRHHLGSYLLLGLEILIAADIIHTLIEPSLEQLAILGAIVAIRTVVNISLNRELRHMHQECGRNG